MRCHGGGRRLLACGRFRCRGGVRVGCSHRCLLRGKGRDGVSLFCAQSRARACAAAGGRIAAARFARVIARARRHTHLARPFPPGCFSRPPAIAFCRNAERRPPGSRLSLLSFYTIPPNVKSIREQKMKMTAIFHELPTVGTGADPSRTARSPNHRPGPRLSSPPSGEAGARLRSRRQPRIAVQGRPRPSCMRLPADRRV